MRHKALILKAVPLAAALVAAAAAESPAIERLRSDAELEDAVAQDELGTLYAEGRGRSSGLRRRVAVAPRGGGAGVRRSPIQPRVDVLLRSRHPLALPARAEVVPPGGGAGHAGARFKLGLMYAKGQVVPRSYREALTAWDYLRETADSPGRLATLLAVGAAWAGVVALPGLTYVIARRKRGASACRPPARGEPEKG